MDLEGEELEAFLSPTNAKSPEDIPVEEYSYLFDFPKFEDDEKQLQEKETVKAITRILIKRADLYGRKLSLGSADNENNDYHRDISLLHPCYKLPDDVTDSTVGFTKNQVVEVLRNALKSCLLHYGFEVVEMDKEDNVYLKVKATEVACKWIACRVGYTLLADAITVCKEEPSSFLQPSLIYDPAIEESDRFAPHGFVYQRYDELSEATDSTTVSRVDLMKQSIFTDLDRLKLIYNFLKLHFNIDGAVRYGYMTAAFPLHQPRKLFFLKDWASFKKVYTTEQPSDMIRGYFGEEIALYFEWVAFYNRALFIPAIAGLAVFVFQQIFDRDLSFKTPWLNWIRCIWSIAISCWMTYFFSKWQQKEKDLITKWGIDDSDKLYAQEFRADFRADRLVPHPLYPDKMIKSYGAWKHGLRHLVSATISGVLVVICAVMVNGDVHQMLFHYIGWEDKLKELDGFRKTFTDLVDIPTIITAIMVFVFDMMFTSIVELIVKFENHRYDHTKTGSEISKIFSFRSVDYYAPLFYFAFFKVHVDAYLGVPESETDPYCLRMLRKQLGALFVIGLFLTAVEVLVPMIRVWIQRAKKKKMTPEEFQANQAEFANTIPEFEELMTQLGLVSMFSMVLPIIPALALMSNLLEQRADAFKLVRAHRRPVPKEASDLQVWKDIQRFLSLLCLFVNIALCVFSTMGHHYSLVKKLIVCSILMTIGFTLREIVLFAVPQESFEVTRLRLHKSSAKQKILWGDSGAHQYVVFTT